MTAILLEPEIDVRLGALAAKSGRSKADYLREVIERAVEDAEDCYLAAAASERFHCGKERSYSSAEVRKELGLDD